MTDPQNIYFEPEADSEVPIYFEADGQVERIDFKPEPEADNEVLETMQQAQQLIRDYSEYALNAFKDFTTATTAELEEVTLKFGIKMGGRGGIPFVTEGSAEGNLQIEIKCKFPVVSQK